MLTDRRKGAGTIHGGAHENFRNKDGGCLEMDQITTITFGTSTGPLQTASAGRDEPAEEFDRGNVDPDKLLQCPFDKNHQIRSCRFPYHLLKCRKNHPKLAGELKTCPYNARHLVPKHELSHHTETCEDRIAVDMENDAITSGDTKWQVPVSTWVNPIKTEDWDDEADDRAAPFVWGENTAVTIRLCNEAAAAGGIEMCASESVRSQQTALEHVSELVASK